MGRPWNRIALDFVVGIVTLVAARQLRRLEDDTDSEADADNDDQSIRLDMRWAFMGAVSSIGWLYAYDTDAVGLRRSMRRRLVLTACWSGFADRVLPNDVATTYSLSVGTGIGTLCYRFWFGLVRPRPGAGTSNSSGSGE